MSRRGEEKSLMRLFRSVDRGTGCKPAPAGRIANATQCTNHPMVVRTKASGHLLSERSRLCSYARPAYKFFDYKTREVKKGGLGKRHCLTTGRRSCAAWLFLTRSFVSKSLSALTFFGYFFVSRQKSIRGPGQRPGCNCCCQLLP
jgi:hypothetical protein